MILYWGVLFPDVDAKKDDVYVAIAAHTHAVRYAVFWFRREDLRLITLVMNGQLRLVAG